MLFVIHGIDKPGSDIRERLIDAHREYLSSSPVPVVSSGPLVDDEGQRMIGSVIIVEAADREDVEALMAGDPMNRAGLYESLHISRWHQRVGAFSGHEGVDG